VIEVIETEGLIDKARRIEAIALPRLQALIEQCEFLGDVRGRGAMLAMEFVKPRSKEPAADFTKAVAAACHAQGVLTLVCGTFGNVIRLLPPLVIDETLLDDALNVIEEAVRTTRVD